MKNAIWFDKQPASQQQALDALNLGYELDHRHGFNDLSSRPLSSDVDVALLVDDLKNVVAASGAEGIFGRFAPQLLAALELTQDDTGLAVYESWQVMMRELPKSHPNERTRLAYTHDRWARLGYTKVLNEKPTNT